MTTAGGNEMEEQSVRLSPGQPSFSLNLPIRQPNKRVERLDLSLREESPQHLGKLEMSNRYPIYKCA